jgi:DNA-binding winged helix-turn-helix (wHTH) protein/tetratricopeptide (TPR) repeat protein
MAELPAVDRVRFGAFEFDTRTLELCRKGRTLRVRPQSLKLLRLLVRHRGELVTREAIHEALWDADTFVDFEQGVNHAIRELRAAVGDTAEAPRYIETLPRRGYRFIAPVATDAPQTPEPAPRVEPMVEAAAALPTVATPPDAIASRRRPFDGRGVGLFLVFGLVIMLGLSYLLPAHDRPSSARAAVSVHAFSAAPDDAWLGVGLANAIETRLIEQARLPAARSTDSVGAVLEGEVLRRGEIVRVFARLRDREGATLWSDRFDIRAGELFSVENVIAERVIAALDLQLAAEEQHRLRRRYTSNSAAYEHYLRGRAALVLYTPDATREAVDAFEQALQLDPRYALARAGLAMACADMYLRFSPPDDVEQWGERADAEARRALDLDADLAEAHLARAAVARKREFDWNLTMAASRRASTLNPTLEQAHFFTAAAYYHLGYMEEALIALERGRRLGGFDEIEAIRIEALVALFSGRFSAARAHLEDVSRRSSQTIGDTYLALAFYYTGNTDQGVTMLTRLASHHTAATAARAGAALAGVLAAEGRAASAEEALARVVSSEYRDHHVAYGLGAAYAQLGNAAAAVRWLRMAADTGFPCLVWFERDPLLAPLRSQTSWPELLSHVRRIRESSLWNGGR